MTTTKKTATISIVVPALDESDNVAGLVDRVIQAQAAHPEHLFELVLVDDGSTDGTGEAAESAARGRVPLVVVELARSFGSHQAISAGLHHASGECVIVVGADAQEPPS